MAGEQSIFSANYKNTLTTPLLMVFYHNINPVIAKLGMFQIRWYGLFYVIGFIIAYFLIRYLAKEKGLKLSQEDILDFLVYLAIGVILGGRLGYILIYDLQYYLQSPLQVFAVWQGGMSFHGGVIGTIIAGLLFCRKKKINFYDVADIVVVPLTLALALGRFGNFINGELYGRITDGSFCIDYTKNQYLAGPPEGCRWPSQLFEVGKNLIIFSTLWMIKYKKLPKGFMFWTFITMYGGIRFIIEFTRQPDAQIGYILGLTTGQLLCLPMFLVGMVMLFRLKNK
jgi:phosphatidylglycerol---prolipoprotein diacylglyceryl transferase